MAKKHPQDNSELTFYAILAAVYIVALIILFLIGLARVIFWFSVITIIISLVVGIILFIIWLLNRDDMWADKDDYWLFAVIAFGLCIVFYLFASISYQFGYSDNAISLKMQAE